MKVQIDVTQEDLDEGVRCSFRKCPIARAIRRVFGGSWSVGSYTAVYRDDSRSFIYSVDLPREATVFMRAFDTGDMLAPFSFEVGIPDAVKAALEKFPVPSAIVD